jgi:hypothetical protein
MGDHVETREVLDKYILLLSWTAYDANFKLMLLCIMRRLIITEDPGNTVFLGSVWWWRKDKIQLQGASFTTKAFCGPNWEIMKRWRKKVIFVLYVSILCVIIYICLVIYLTFNTRISISKIQVPLFMATFFGNKYHLQAIFKCLPTNRK